MAPKRRHPTRRKRPTRTPGRPQPRAQLPAVRRPPVPAIPGTPSWERVLEAFLDTRESPETRRAYARLDGAHLLPLVRAGVVFADGVQQDESASGLITARPAGRSASYPLSESVGGSGNGRRAFARANHAPRVPRVDSRGGTTV